MSLLEAYILCPVPEIAKRDFRMYTDSEQLPDLHLTLATIAPFEDVALPRLREVMRGLARTLKPLDLEVAGTGVFFNGDQYVELAMICGVGLDLWRITAINALYQSGFRDPLRFGFIPHVTLNYVQHGGSFEVPCMDPRPTWEQDILTLSYTLPDADDFTVEAYPLRR